MSERDSKKYSILELAYFYFGLGPLLGIVLARLLNRLSVSGALSSRPPIYLPILEILLMRLIIPLLLRHYQHSLEKGVRNIAEKYWVYKISYRMLAVCIIGIYVDYIILSIIEVVG